MIFYFVFFSFKSIFRSKEVSTYRVESMIFHLWVLLSNIVLFCYVVLRKLSFRILLSSLVIYFFKLKYFLLTATIIKIVYSFKFKL